MQRFVGLILGLVLLAGCASSNTPPPQQENCVAPSYEERVAKDGELAMTDEELTFLFGDSWKSFCTMPKKMTEQEMRETGGCMNPHVAKPFPNCSPPPVGTRQYEKWRRHQDRLEEVIRK